LSGAPVDSLDIYLGQDGTLALRKALGMAPGEIIAEINRSFLRGRGGAERELEIESNLRAQQNQWMAINESPAARRCRTGRTDARIRRRWRGRTSNSIWRES
jgi:hypothetical protein